MEGSPRRGVKVIIDTNDCLLLHLSRSVLKCIASLIEFGLRETNRESASIHHDGVAN